MTNHEKSLLRLDLKKIDANGRYVDFENILITHLSYEDILFLRSYYQDKNIAKNFEFQNIKPLEPERLKTQGQTQRKKAPAPTRAPQPKQEPVRQQRPANSKPASQQTQRPAAKQKPAAKKNLALSKENKYTGQHHKGITFTYRRLAAAAGVLFICLTSGLYLARNNVQTIPANPGIGIESTYTGDVAGTSDTIATTKPTSPVMSEQQMMRNICDEVAAIYQIDADDLYNVIASNTDNFTSDDYLTNYTFEGVSYKGSGQVLCTNPTQMAIITARAMDQDPERFNLNRDNIKEYTQEKTEKNYDNYVEMIGYYCEILGEDPCLIYGIMQAETGWDSRLLNELNNPAGLKLNNGKWWEFETIESGICELIFQVHAYRMSGANTVEEIAAIHCPIGDPDDVNEVNQFWVGNVKSGMEEAKTIYANMNYGTSTHRH